MREMRLNIMLNSDELQVLAKMAVAECRPPKEQLRYILRQEATRRGLLPESSIKSERQTDESNPSQRIEASDANAI